MSYFRFIARACSYKIEPTTKKRKGKSQCDSSIEKKMKKKSSTPRRFNFMDLPTEIMFDILSRLSLTSILCLACNNKELNEVISKSNTLHHPYTLFVYNDRGKTKIELVEYRDGNSNDDNMAVTRIDIGGITREPQSPKRQSFNVLCSYNGLLIVQPKFRRYSECSPEPKLHLVNPVTRQSLILPQPLKPPQFFKRMRGQCSYVLGCSKKTGQLKLVRLTTIQHCEEGSRYCTQVLDIGCGTRELRWRRIEWDDLLCRLVMFHQFSFKRRVVLNGAIHWYTLCRTNFIFLRFNFDEEKFDLVDFTFLYRVSSPIVESIGLLGGSLYVSIWNREVIEIWVMKEYGVKESWTRLYEIPSNDYRRKVLQIFEDGKLLIRSSGWLYLYDLIARNEGQKYDTGKKLEMFNTDHRCMQVLPFVPNLS